MQDVNEDSEYEIIIFQQLFLHCWGPNVTDISVCLGKFRLEQSEEALGTRVLDL